MRVSHFLRENWYRDVWLLLISIIVLVVAFQVVNIAEDLVSSRKVAIRDSCTADNVQTDVLRSLIDQSLTQQDELRKQGKSYPGMLSREDAEALLDQVLKPLGGFHPTPEQKKAICDLRVKRGSP